ncbi:Gfo/Idh/MocA family protein [Pelagibacterium sp.]|uniref:Gfo/Idh/MocA family protein n=1 Tax=Pelagibacterium sp. TaxID=1967288 RepID=UPI003A918A60
MTLEVAALQQAWPLPSAPRPIVIIGGGGIVNDAHLPAYKLAGLPVAGVYDLDNQRARTLAEKWDIAAFETLGDAVSTPNAVFDLALPPSAHLKVMPELPDGACVLLQKPMGSTLGEASEILQLARKKSLKAAVNFQLRFSPIILAIADVRRRGWLGDLIDVDLHVNILTPWHLFPFLQGLPRIEIAVHSIHYLDMLRGLLGNPSGVHARTMGHPKSDMAQTRTSALLDFGDEIRTTMSVNHNHGFGRKFQDATFKFEGTKGVAVAKMGVLLDYPNGEPDELWIGQGEDQWTEVPLAGSWFPHAFIGTMSNLQRFAAGEDKDLVTSVEDAWHTMALVEAAFDSAARPATPLQSKPRSI